MVIYSSVSSVVYEKSTMYAGNMDKMLGEINIVDYCFIKNANTIRNNSIVPFIMEGIVARIHIFN